ncbi:hypothetical protein NKDENANG_02953 [Candidatus Entotheonellaceae bacterium PAL068K]
MDVTITDTCCLINLYASQRLTVIVGASIEKALVPKVILGESLYIRQPSDDKPDQLISVEINLQPLIDAGVLKPT